MRYQMIIAFVWTVTLAGEALSRQQQPATAPSDLSTQLRTPATVPSDLSTQLRTPATNEELDKQLNENIEIMCRLLDRAVRKVTGDTARGVEPLSILAGHTWRNAEGNHQITFGTEEHTGYLFKSPQGGYAVQFAGLSPLLASFQKQRIEGTYLKGYGVVFSVTLPITRLLEVSKQPQKLSVEASSDWERLRRELHGEKVGKTEEAVKREPPSLADEILKVLAENGQHFANLAENDQLAVAITLRSSRAGKSNAMSSDEIAKSIYLDEIRTHPQVGMALGGALEGDKWFGVKAAEATPPPTSSDSQKALVEQLPGEVRNLLLLGDLEMKQNRSRDAAAHFQQALSLFQIPLQEAEKEGANTETQARQSLAELMLLARLAESRMADGDAQKAQKALQELAKYLKKLEAKAQTLREKAGQVRKEAGTEKHASVRLPAKLILAVPKRLLDTGRVNLEEFKKHVSVTYRSWGEE
jgi:tetratricopeptide (TPR) repeat protein